ncbi:MAG: IucA/IucC family protein [Methylococcaceae bacterium]|jgi:siderophore synthetase component
MNNSPLRANPQYKMQQDYICRRVLNAFIRENVRDIVSRGSIVCSADVMLPDMPISVNRWLVVWHLGDGSLWIPVQACTFMQDWQLGELALVWHTGSEHRVLTDLPAILALFWQNLDPDLAAGFIDYAQECLVSVEHGVLCQQEQERYFTELQMAGSAPPNPSNWSGLQLYYERLAAFLDHPLYPTARAKLGLTAEQLSRYSPEFQQPFQLRWLAVAKPLHIGTSAALSLQGLAPSFADVGLDEALGDEYSLLPLHPLFKQQDIDNLARNHRLQGKLLLAPKPYLQVNATLSVRTVAVCDKPGLHIKLPIHMRTLGGKNIRTIKPSTIVDGNTVQCLLALLASQDAQLSAHLLLTDESQGAHINNIPELAYIIRRYPDTLAHTTVVPVAGLLATTPQQQTVVMELALRFFKGQLHSFIDAYLNATLSLHLRLWMRYGIALESNQQNTMLVLSSQPPNLRLLLKDNDAPRIYASRLSKRAQNGAAFIKRIQDQRILVADELPLAQMFTTITLQLNIAALLEGLDSLGLISKRQLYSQLRGRIEALLTELEVQGEDTVLARRILLEEDTQYVKYLLTAASLISKKESGANDVNKFYGKSAPNFLKVRL